MTTRAFADQLMAAPLPVGNHCDGVFSSRVATEAQMLQSFAVLTAEFISTGALEATRRLVCWSVGSLYYQHQITKLLDNCHNNHRTPHLSPSAQEAMNSGASFAWTSVWPTFSCLTLHEAYECTHTHTQCYAQTEFYQFMYNQSARLHIIASKTYFVILGTFPSV